MRALALPKYPSAGFWRWLGQQFDSKPEVVTAHMSSEL